MEIVLLIACNGATIAALFCIVALVYYIKAIGRDFVKHLSPPISSYIHLDWNKVLKNIPFHLIVGWSSNLLGIILQFPGFLLDRVLNSFPTSLLLNTKELTHSSVLCFWPTLTK